ncbi:Tm-1-like ATP-binding domain-containing protein [Halocatena marina]|uniref:Tm-1-like ATP-binding domain-containing protein n=1 Tax=Halocatena marina TaxID=2934937 RepID=UPI00200F9A9E|nr:Tm-1-like ATP-binding domain-containing protein [Halocatena marina]
MSIVIIGTLDTKSEEIGFARDVIEAQDGEVHIIDAGVLGEPEFAPDTTADEVAEAGGTSIESLREDGARGDAVDVMGRGAAEIAQQLHKEGVLSGVLGLGGSGNTSIATTAMRALPVGIPKLVVSTMASGDVEPYVGVKDITMMYSVADIEGLNRLSRRIIANAALAMVGMVETDVDMEIDKKPTIAITMFGVTTPCVRRAREYLEDHGYETIVFHATGTGGQAMEELVREGVIDGVLDVTTTEWADQHVGGILNAGPDRLSAPGEVGIPHVVSTGALDMVNFGPPESVPDEFSDRTFYQHNPQVTLMRTTPEETAAIGTIIAEKLNEATGPTAVYLPLNGISILDIEGGEFNDPAADEALFEAIRETRNDDIELVEMETDINDDAFAVALAKAVDELVRESDST